MGVSGTCQRARGSQSARGCGPPRHRAWAGAGSPAARVAASLLGGGGRGVSREVAWVEWTEGLRSWGHGAQGDQQDWAADLLQGGCQGVLQLAGGVAVAGRSAAADEQLAHGNDDGDGCVPARHGTRRFLNLGAQRRRPTCDHDGDAHSAHSEECGGGVALRCHGGRRSRSPHIAGHGGDRSCAAADAGDGASHS